MKASPAFIRWGTKPEGLLSEFFPNLMYQRVELASPPRQMRCQDGALASPEHKPLLEPFPLLPVLLGAPHPPALRFSAVFSSSKPYRGGPCWLPIPAENTAPCLPEGGFCPGATNQTTACGATGVKRCLSSLSRDPVLQIWSQMGNKCSSNWQKKCYPIVLRRWETCLHWPYRFWATRLVHPHKNVCPTSLRSPEGCSSGTHHKICLVETYWIHLTCSYF